VVVARDVEEDEAALMRVDRAVVHLGHLVIGQIAEDVDADSGKAACTLGGANVLIKIIKTVIRSKISLYIHSYKNIFMDPQAKCTPLIYSSFAPRDADVVGWQVEGAPSVVSEDAQAASLVAGHAHHGVARGPAMVESPGGVVRRQVGAGELQMAMAAGAKIMAMMAAMSTAALALVMLA